MIKIKNSFLFILLVSIFLNSCTVNTSLEVTDLKCMYLENPIGIDAATPDLSWILQSENNGIIQDAYQIIVSSSLEKISNNEGDIWDSGKIASKNSTHVKYNGNPLETATKYFWRVKVWDNQGNVSPWSEPSFWSMGILDAVEWKANWITYDYSKSSSMPLFRKEFKVKKDIKQAFLFVSGLGYSETYLNGKKLGDNVLDPAQTNYDIYSFYVSYDVSESLNIGDNMLGVMLGDGWYKQDLAFGIDLSYDKPKLICQLMLEYTDGEQDLIVSDSSWEWAEGPVVSANVYAGENYDARKELANWSETGSTEGVWNSAITATDNPPALRAQMLQPIKKMKELKSTNFKKIEDGRYVFDLGQNFAGWVRIKVNEASGTTIKLRMSEEVFKDGTLNCMSTGDYVIGFEQVETYICKGDGTEIWEPRFTYHGFRYVEISGLTSTPDLETITGVVVYSSVPNAGTFACSNENINRLHKMAIWTQISNLHGVPTDCPHREKSGWLGDAHALVHMSIYNFGMEAFWIKYLADIRSSAKREGVTIFHKSGNQDFYQKYKDPGIPFMIAPGKRECGAASSDWGTALVQIPWFIYVYYDNKEILNDYYPDMKTWVTYLENLAVDNLILEGLGDWCPPQPEWIDCPHELSSTAFYYLDLTIMEKSAKLFHNTDDEQHYKQIREKVRQAFNSRFYDSVNHTYGSQTANILAIDLGLAPQGDEHAIADAIVKDMDDNFFGFHHTGIFGLTRLFDVLSKNNHKDVAYRLLGTGGKASFENMWKIYDATTLWERLPVEDYSDSIKLDLQKQSHNHPMQGGFDAWFYKGIAGIAPTEEDPGFTTIQFEPLLVNQLEWAEATYDSRLGTIKSSWKWEDNTFVWNVSIPANSSGIIHLPLDNYSLLTVNNEKIESGDSKSFSVKDGIIELNSGKYLIELSK